MLIEFFSHLENYFFFFFSILNIANTRGKPIYLLKKKHSFIFYVSDSREIKPLFLTHTPYFT